ncbi:MAG: Eco57I restriction-modification methylase domain-containing protein, partial [Campylobacterales bacterium]
MALYQPKLLKEQKQDEALVAKRWALYHDYKAKSSKIKEWKEEEYQDGFLRDVFENCLGYTLKTSNPESYNLEREKKNETDSKKADGVIHVDGKVLGVIELKDQKTKNLDRVEQQAFWYLTQHSDAKYVIISNFDEIRFYVEKSTAYERFYLFELDYDGFQHLHLLLSYESIEAGLPLRLKEKSVGFEQQISKDLYKDFSAFRLQLFENIMQNNDQREPKELLRLTQKLCDRIIFILFAEDRGLLRANTIKEIREEFKNQKFTNYKLYDIYKFYFHAINEGNEKLDIPKYNGGLFASDEVLDSLLIDDECLDMKAQKLSDYDFLSDVGVNILGHIFEQSLTDLEELTASIEKQEFDKTKTKRKKDGVFYTPEYITKYIVENTLGKLCEEKKKELDIPIEIEVKNPRKLLKKEQMIKDAIISYREWLKELKILDPACGSGAFLNQALEYLIAEHTLVRDLLLPYADLTIGYEIEKEILENNLYGVDINEDATEIAKLSLWLRTAYKGRELTKLADKIVCANSLLDMPSPEGSFDVVIGNPPYVRQEMIENEIKENYIDKYTKVATSTADLYVYFYELSIKLLKEKGLLGFITPNKWMERKYGANLRKYLKAYNILEIINYGELSIFDDASTEPATIVLKNEVNENDISYLMIKSIEEAQSLNYKTFSYKKDTLSNEIWRFTNPIIYSILNKFKNTDIDISDYTKG